MFKLDLEKAEEPEIKLPTFIGSWRKQGNSGKPSTSSPLTTLKPLTVWITTNWKILKDMGVPDHLTCLPRNLYLGQEAISQISRLIIYNLDILLSLFGTSLLFHVQF